MYICEVKNVALSLLKMFIYAKYDRNLLVVVKVTVGLLIWICCTRRLVLMHMI